MDHFCHAPRWVCFSKQVYVIRHDRQAVNRYLQLFGLLLKQGLETLLHWFNQDWTVILQTPHQMIFEAATCILGVLTQKQSIQRARVSIGVESRNSSAFSRMC